MVENVLVTGGNGFIGSYVVNNLRERGVEVTIFDRHNCQHLPGVKQFTGDIKDSEAVLTAVSESTGVIHLAGLLGTSETIDNPQESVLVNTLGSLNVFQACVKFGIPCSYITVGNYWMNNSYSISKTTAERFAWMLNRERGGRISVVRALNAYGPKQKDAPVRKVVPNFILPALRGENLIVYGDGSQVMDMIYVEDVADIMVRTLFVDHQQYVFDPQRDTSDDPRFEAGTGRRTTVRAIAEMVIDLVGDGKISYRKMRGGEPLKSVVLGDPETLRPLYSNELPKLLSLEEGLKRTIDYYREIEWLAKPEEAYRHVKVDVT